jgi:hypothetical protein
MEFEDAELVQRNSYSVRESTRRNLEEKDDENGWPFLLPFVGIYPKVRETRSPRRREREARERVASVF